MPGTQRTGEITRLLRAHHEGDRDAFDRLLPLVYERMCRIAGGQLARRGGGLTLDANTLAHDAYLQLVEETGVDWRDRSHFFAVCARVMRRLVVDHARRRASRKRGGDRIDLPLSAELAVDGDRTERVLALDQILERLAAHNERLVRVVECRFFAGMTEEETAAALGISLRTVQRHWLRGRAWLRHELGE